MNIELVGIPGVGKSYLCRSVEARLRDERESLADSALPLTTPWLKSSMKFLPLLTVRKILAALCFVICHPLTVVRIVRVIFRQRDGRVRRRLTKLINLFAEMQRLHSPDAGVSLMTEQGVLQGVWSLEMLAQDSIMEPVMLLIENWLPDAVVVVKAEGSQLEKQLAFRELGQSTFDQLRGRELTLAIQRGEQKMTHILSLWERLRSDGRRLDFLNEPDNGAVELYEWLSAELR